jgi:hypothetical protein
MVEFLVIGFLTIVFFANLYDKHSEIENRELINKALKDYNKTKGIK